MQGLSSLLLREEGELGVRGWPGARLPLGYGRLDLSPCLAHLERAFGRSESMNYDTEEFLRASSRRPDACASALCGLRASMALPGRTPRHGPKYDKDQEIEAMMVGTSDERADL